MPNFVIEIIESMFHKHFIILLFLSFQIWATDEKENKAPITQQASKESSFIQTDAKKSKPYEIYTIDGKFVTKGILDFNSRADVSDLSSGDYLIVIGKKAYQFHI